MSKIGKFGKRLKFWKKDKNKPKKTKLKNRNETKTSTMEFEEQNMSSVSKQKPKKSKRKERDDPKTTELEDKMTQLVLENEKLKLQLQDAASQTENGLPRMSEAQVTNFIISIRAQRKETKMSPDKGHSLNDRPKPISKLILIDSLWSIIFLKKFYLEHF